MALYAKVRQFFGAQKSFPRVLTQFSDQSSVKIPETAHKYNQELR
ncbi:unnamed protein product, partial [Cercopithifilaria johnstoni]